jgi:hypothetical protein
MNFDQLHRGGDQTLIDMGRLQSERREEFGGCGVKVLLEE